MNTDSAAPQTIDDYIANFPKDIQDILEKIRAVVKTAAPDAEEKISYQMPTFYLNGNLVHFAAFKKHIGLYPTPSGITEFNEQLSPYVKAKGSIQFPLDQPIPYELIGKVVEFRARENRNKANLKRRNKG